MESAEISLVEDAEISLVEDAEISMAVAKSRLGDASSLQLKYCVGRHFNESQGRQRMQLLRHCSATVGLTPISGQVSGWVDRVSATDWESIPGRIKLKTMKIDIYSLATRRWAMKFRKMKKISLCVVDRRAGGSLTRKPGSLFADS